MARPHIRPKVRFPLPTPPADGPVEQVVSARPAAVGGGSVHRHLPHPKRRMIGAWCFVDHFGPFVRGDRDLDVGPHPHIGLQTVTWLLSRRIRHRDSLGTEQVIRSGQVNWMTAGHGISHSEDGENAPGDVIHGVQLWVALPESARHGPPAFHHDPSPPRFRVEDAELTLLVGSLAGRQAPAPAHSPLLGADVLLDGAVGLALDPGFEHGVVGLEGAVKVGETVLEPGTSIYLGRGRSELSLEGTGRVLLLGGSPLDEPVLLWWNWVFRDRSELVAATEQWNAADPRFGTVEGAGGARLVAPDVPPSR